MVEKRTVTPLVESVLNMDHHLVTFDPIKRFILIEHFGNVDQVSIAKTRSKALTLAKQYSCFKVLADLRKATASLSFSST